MQLINGIFTIALFLGYLILWRIKRHEIRKSEGVDVNVLSKATRPIQQYFSVLEKGMTVAIVLIIAAHILVGEQFIATNYLGRIDTLTFKIIGLAIGVTGLLLCRIAQVTIGRSWRVGIDEQAKPGLITNGIYKYMRNPTYTGLFLMCSGLWLINPTILYSFWIFAFFMMMEFQVRCEEEYLLEKYDDAYRDYCRKTKRYLPLVY